jgi:hypothetical protein
MMMGVIGAIASAASGFASMSAQQDAMNKQNEANAQWVAYQRREREQAMARDEQMRQKSESARQDTLNQLTPDAQKAAQDTEQQRLTKDLTPTNLQGPTPAVGDELLAGLKGADPAVTQDLTKRINNAAVQARTRIANLATVQSYGGSQFGLQNRAQDLFNQSGENIRLWSDERQGNLAALGVATNVEPEKFQATPSAWGGIAGSLAGLAGKGLTTPNISGGGNTFFG